MEEKKEISGALAALVLLGGLMSILAYTIVAGKVVSWLLDTVGFMNVLAADTVIFIVLYAVALSGRRGRVVGTLWDAVGLTHCGVIALSFASILSDTTQEAVFGHLLTCALFGFALLVHGLVAQGLGVKVFIMQDTSKVDSRVEP